METTSARVTIPAAQEVAPLTSVFIVYVGKSMNFERRIAPLLQKREKNRAFYGQLIRENEKRTNSDEYDNLVAEYNNADDLIQAEIDSLLTQTIIAEAESLYIPLPPRSEKRYWKEPDYLTNGVFLSPDGICLLRDAIREERKKRRDIIFSYVEIAGRIVVIFTGLVGACIGLVSILKQ